MTQFISLKQQFVLRHFLNAIQIIINKNILPSSHHILYPKNLLTYNEILKHISSVYCTVHITTTLKVFIRSKKLIRKEEKILQKYGSVAISKIEREKMKCVTGFL